MIFVEKKTQINGLYEKKVKTSNDDIAGNGRAKVYQYFSITNEFLGEKKNFPLNFFFFQGCRIHEMLLVTFLTEFCL